jgi:hypothetical protein
MTNISSTDHYVEIINSDDDRIRILKDCTQLQLETQHNDAYIDIDVEYLKELKSQIEQIILEHE